MNRILKAKHWQIFILLIIGLIIGNINIETNTLLNVAFLLTGMFIYMVYPFSVGIELQEYLPKEIKLNSNLFLFNSFIWFLAYSATMILTDGEGTMVTGIKVLPIFYVFYAFIHFLSFPAMTLKSIEMGKRAKFGDYIGDLFMIIFLPIGIWFLQPRIKRVIEINDKQK